MRRRHGFCLLLLLSVSACQRAPAPTVPAPTDHAASAPAALEPAASSVAGIDANAGTLRIGSALDAAGNASAAREHYQIGQPMYVSLLGAGAGANARAHVYWVRVDNGLAVHEEEQRLHGAPIHFAFVPDAAGAYKVEVDVDDSPAGIVAFEVVAR